MYNTSLIKYYTIVTLNFIILKQFYKTNLLNSKVYSIAHAVHKI